MPNVVPRDHFFLPLREKIYLKSDYKCVLVFTLEKKEESDLNPANLNLTYFPTICLTNGEV